MILTLILIIIFFICKAFADTIKFHWSTSIFFNIKNIKLKNWLDPNNYINMYKNGDPKQGEKFWGSSRWFAFLADGWHFIILFQILSILLAITLYPAYVPISGILITNIIIGKTIDAFIFYVIGSGIIFETFFSKILKK